MLFWEVHYTNNNITHTGSISLRYCLSIGQISRQLTNQLSWLNNHSAVSQSHFVANKLPTNSSTSTLNNQLIS